MNAFEKLSKFYLIGGYILENYPPYSYIPSKAYTNIINNINNVIQSNVLNEL